MIQLDNKSPVLCFGGEDWWYHNRGHVDMQLMRRLARERGVLYINSLVMQKPNFKRATGGGRSFTQKLLRKTKSMLRGLCYVPAGFWVYSPLSLPVHHIAVLRPANNRLLFRQITKALEKLKFHCPIVWVACPTACDIATQLDREKLVYQRTDRFEDYPNVDEATVRTCDQKLKQSADLTVFVNEQLYAEECRQCQRALYLDHGVDYSLFADAASNPIVPEDLATVPRPIVGFFGGIDEHTSDIAFLEKVVTLLPELSFVFVGKASADVSQLRQNKNVWMLGQKTYEQIPNYGKLFDVAIMVWHQNDWIKACNPIKLKEYLALGKPVVSTPFPQLKDYLNVVYQADTPESFAACLRAALAENDPNLTHERQALVRESTWDKKADSVLVELADATAASGRLYGGQ